MKELMEQRAHLFKQMEALHEKARAEKRDLTPDEVKEWDRLDGELTKLDAQIERETKFEARKAAAAQSAGTLVGAQGGKAPAEAKGSDKLFGSKFGRWNLEVADIEFLFDLQESLRGQRKVDNAGVYEGPSEELRNAFNDISEALYIPQEEIRRIDKQALDNLFPRIPLSQFRGKDRYWAKRGDFDRTSLYQAELRAMDTAESGYGSQLVGAQYVGDLWEAARNQSRVFNLLDTFEMTAPTVYMPVEVDIPEMLYVSENTSASASNYTTVKTGSNRVSVTAKKFLIHQMWSGEMEEDSIIPFIPFLRRQAQLSLAHYSDSAVINGDTTTTGINAVDTVLTATDHTLALDGIRHAGLVDNTGNRESWANAAVSLEAFKKVYGRMLDATYLHDWGHPTDPNDLIHLVDPYVADNMLLMDEFLTVDKFGQNATILNGQVARVFNHPVISSIAIKKTDTTGSYDADTAGNNLYGQIVSFNRRGLKVGWRRRVKVETERIPATDQSRIVYSLRMGLGRFSPTGAASGIEWADTVYYINI